jgi:hypothetical protein
MGSRRRWTAAAAIALLLGSVWALAWGSRDANADQDACAPTCVILIQVDGLEPKDVTQATTPYMWSLAHPPTTAVPGSALVDRAGWIWQAPRGVASASTAPATASLLTGAYPEKTGITGDDFFGAAGKGDHQRLGVGGFGDTPDVSSDEVASPVSPPAVDTVIGLMEKGRAAVYLGDPGLAELTGANSALPHWYPPGEGPKTGSATYPEQQFTGDPRLCPVPRYPDRAREYRSNPPTGSDATPDGYDPSFCPANDFTTVHKAIGDLQKTESKRVGFTFIHLAEYGAAKRLAGDPKADKSDPNADQSTAPPQPPQALANADAAIATFVERYNQGDTDKKWGRTVLMVVGTHGYQVTPASNRVPDPGNPNAPLPNEQTAATTADPTRDLSDFVHGYSRNSVAPGSLQLVSQGTMATIHYIGQDPNGRAHALKVIKEELEGDVLKAACAQRNPAQPNCIDHVYYVDKNTPGTTDTVAALHPTWRLDTYDPKAPHGRTKAGGDLLVVLGRGWASGRAVGMTYQTGSGKAVTNPYTASAGGPQERAVAALINGPALGDVPGAVRNLDTFAGRPLTPLKYYPLSKTKVDPSDNEHPPAVPAAGDQRCPDTNTDPGGLGCANDPTVVPDDAGTTGHEAQPVTVDFALTISALMKLPFETYPDQLQGRVLQEAFVNKLTPPCVSDCEPPPPPTCFDVASLTMSTQPVPVSLSCTDERGAPLTYRIVSGPSHGTLGAVAGDAVTYTAADGFSGNDTFTYEAASKYGTSEVATATVIVMEPPVVVRPPEFDFYGLVRRLRAGVVDSMDRPYAKAPRGTVLSTIHLEADFGKPETAVTLTFYRRAAGAARNGRVVRLKAIARFDPFVVKRGHVTMRLKVPPQFNPNYVGVTVREIAMTGTRRRTVGGVACTTLKTLKPVPFRCTGPSSGVILPIADAGHLHKRKPGRAPRRRR